MHSFKHTYFFCSMSFGPSQLMYTRLQMQNFPDVTRFGAFDITNVQTNKQIELHTLSFNGRPLTSTPLCLK